MSRHAYLIIAHNNWYILSKLVSLLDNSRNDIYIHIDKNSYPSSYLEQSIKNQVKEAKVLFIESRPVSWGGYSLIDVTLRLMATATEEYHYSYYHLLSGSDLPLKDQYQIHEFFDANQGSEFIHFGKKEWIDIIQSRMKYYWIFQEYVGNSKRIDKIAIRFLNRMCVLFQKIIGINRLVNLQVSGGSEWFSITDESARFLLSKRDFIERHFKYCICADESFVQTIIINSDLKKKVYNFNSHNDKDCTLRYIQWENGKPHVLKMEDYDQLINSGCIYARKFDETDKELVDKICMMILDKTEPENSSIEIE